MTKEWTRPALVGWASVLVAALLLTVRVVDALSLTEPRLGPTSGAEWESAFAIWKWIAGEAVYQDPYRIPFAASYYNWLFYAFYGALVEIGLRVFNLPEVWLPTMGKLVSLAVTMAGAVLSWRLLAEAAEPDPMIRALAAPLSFGFFLGPLVGYWAIALNCEMAATVMGVASLWAFLRLRPGNPLAAVTVAAVFSYLAWSFKQSHVFVGVSLGAVLLLRRDWAGLAILTMIHIAGVGAAVGIGSSTYMDMVFLAKQTMFFSIESLARNLANVATKCTPLLAVAGLGIMAAWRAPDRWRRIWTDDRLLLSGVGLVISSVLTVAASAKIGAAENYYFPMAIFFALAGVSYMAAFLPRHGPQIISVGFGLNIVACGLVLAGAVGTVSVRDAHERMMARASCLADQPAPVFSADVALSAPWLLASGPFFALANIYFDDRRLGLPFERNGIAGLIRERYFATVALSAGDSPVYDGQSLDGYRHTALCGGLDIYQRAGSTP